MLRGIIIYSILDDRLVSGSYIHSQGDGRWYGETLRKVERGIPGEYESSYFDNPDAPLITGTLLVQTKDSRANMFDLEWRDLQGNPTFEGVGFLRGNYEMVVNYWVARS